MTDITQFKLLSSRSRAILIRIVGLGRPYFLLIFLAFMPIWIYTAYNFSFALFQQIIINLTETKHQESLEQLLKIALIASVGIIAFLIAGEYLKSHIQNLIVGDLKKSMFEKLNCLMLNKLNQLSSSDVFLRITCYSEAIIRIITKDFYIILYNSLIYLVAFVFLARSSIYLALLAASTGPVILLLSNISKKRQDIIIRGQTQTISNIRTLSHQIISGMKEIRIFNIGKPFIRLYLQQINEHKQFTLRLKMLQNVQNQLSNIIKNGFSVVILYFICNMAIQDKISIGEVVAFNYIFGIMHGPVVNIANTIVSVRQGIFHSEMVFDFNDTKDERDLKTEVKTKVPHMAEGKSEFAIVIDNVYLSLENSREQIVKGISLKISEGERVALVGPSGGGKTSLLKLCCGLYLPDSGDIRLLGHSVKADIEAARALVSYIPQIPYVFPGTVSMNIRAGNEGIGESEIHLAAMNAFAHEFIVKMDKGYETRLKESASNISVGQKQRITIARAFCKNAPILAADEPTAYLDKESEEIFYNSIYTKYKNKTLIAAVHKLSTVKDFDRIVVIDKGVIAEEGTHEALLKNNGLYARLFYLQSTGK